MSLADPPTIDPRLPTPLYHQIAERIRWQIETGRLRPNETLEPLRRAAEQWGVNLHTVRHAYAALAREGLIEIQRGSAGTRVAESAARASRSGADSEGTAAGAASPLGARVPGDLDAFLRDCRREARDRFGLERASFAELIAGAAGDGQVATPLVYVVECSEHQCEAHARELAARFAIDARPWPLERGEPPAGTIVATYFHYNDIRRRWPRRLGSVHFITIRPDRALLSRLRDRGPEFLVCERDRATAEAVTGDLEALFAGADQRFRPVETSDPGSFLAGDDDRVTVLLPPRVWAELSDQLRRRPGAVEVTYRFDLHELEALASSLRWPIREDLRRPAERDPDRRSSAGATATNQAPRQEEPC